MFWPEHKCKQCGECCRKKLLVGKEKVILNIYCAALDLDTKKCMMYPWRHTASGRAMRGGHACLKIWQMLWRGVCPRSCAYVKWYHRAWVFDPAQLRFVTPAEWATFLAQAANLRRIIKEFVEKKMVIEKTFKENWAEQVFKEGGEEDANQD